MKAKQFNSNYIGCEHSITFLGNHELLNIPKTAFLSSRRISPEAVLRCCSWATAQRDAGRCVISGFHSALERDVLRLLLKGGQPIVLVLARRLYAPETLEREHPDLKRALDEERLLIVSTSSAARANEETTRKRNQYILAHAEAIVIGALTPGGGLASLVDTLPPTTVTIL